MACMYVCMYVIFDTELTYIIEYFPEQQTMHKQSESGMNKLMTGKCLENCFASLNDGMTFLLLIILVQKRSKSFGDSRYKIHERRDYLSSLISE